jgi:hypothetical protein
LLSRADQKSHHRLSSHNREVLAKVPRAGCFHCGAIFTPNEITDWIDARQVETGSTADGDTALCPRCGIDSVIPEVSGVVLSRQLLSEMKAYWF